MEYEYKILWLKDTILKDSEKLSMTNYKTTMHSTTTHNSFISDTWKTILHKKDSHLTSGIRFVTQEQHFLIMKCDWGNSLPRC